MTNSIICKCLLVMFMIEVILCQDGPCPKILQYKINNDYNIIYGVITVPSPISNMVKLEVKLSIGNSTPSNERFNGNIKFLGTIDDLKEKRPLVYQLDFPTWRNTLPKINSISVNGYPLCPGAALQEGVLTTTVTLTNLLNLLIVNDTDEELPVENPTRESFQIENVFKNINEKNCSFCGCSEDGTHPWFGAVYLREVGIPKLLCGATLITPKLALTEGHCVAPYVNYKLYSTFGRTNLLDWFDDSNTQSVIIKTVSLHPDYSPTSAEANLAILSFSNELQFTDTVRFVCLWTDTNVEKVASKEGLLVDWNKNTSSEITQHLQQNYAVVVDNDKCVTSSNSIFCAEVGNNSGSYNSSSGSAYYVVVNGRWTIRGIVSGSFLKANKTSEITQYVHLLDVHKYIDWIKSFF